MTHNSQSCGQRTTRRHGLALRSAFWWWGGCPLENCLARPARVGGAARSLSRLPPMGPQIKFISPVWIDQQSCSAKSRSAFSSARLPCLDLNRSLRRQLRRCPIGNALSVRRRVFGPLWVKSIFVRSANLRSGRTLTWSVFHSRRQAHSRPLQPRTQPRLKAGSVPTDHQAAAGIDRVWPGVAVKDTGQA